MARKKSNPLRIKSLAINQAAEMLSTAAGRKVDAALIRKDIKNGAPVNEDGTINLVNYAAWLIQQG